MPTRYCRVVGDRLGELAETLELVRRAAQRVIDTDDHVVDVLVHRVRARHQAAALKQAK